MAYERPVAHNQAAQGLRMIYRVIWRSNLLCGTYMLSRFRGHSLGRGLNVVLASDIGNCDDRWGDFFPRELRQLVIVIVFLPDNWRRER